MLFFSIFAVCWFAHCSASTIPGYSFQSPEVTFNPTVIEGNVDVRSEQDFGTGGQDSFPQPPSPPRNLEFGDIEDVPEIIENSNAGSSNFDFQGSIGQNFGSGSQLPPGACGEGQVHNHIGVCVDATVMRQIFVYDPPQGMFTREFQRPDVPKPKLKYNIVFVRVPETPESQQPVVVPPTQQKTIVYVLNKDEGEQGPQIVEMPEFEHHKPEVFYIKYREGENPQLPIGVDLQTALASAIGNQAQIIGGGAGISSGGFNSDDTGSFVSGGSSGGITSEGSDGFSSGGSTGGFSTGGSGGIISGGSTGEFSSGGSEGIISGGSDGFSSGGSTGGFSSGGSGGAISGGSDGSGSGGSTGGFSSGGSGGIISGGSTGGFSSGGSGGAISGGSDGSSSGGSSGGFSSGGSGGIISGGSVGGSPQAPSNLYTEPS